MSLCIQRNQKTRLKHVLLSPFLEKYREKSLFIRETPAKLRLSISNCVQSENKKLLLVKNPKTGCTTAATEIFRYSNKTLPEKNIHHTKEGIFQGVANWRQFTNGLKDPEVFKFTFVRHPEDRFLSGLKNLVLEKKNPSSPRILSALLKCGFKEDSSTSEKIDSLLDCLESSFKQNPLLVEQHFQLQSTCIGFGFIEYNFIGRTEQLDEDLRSAFTMAGEHDYAESLQKLERHNATNRSSITLTKSQREQIENIYKQDYSNFEYESRL